jgi:hypothetical protein
MRTKPTRSQLLAAVSRRKAKPFNTTAAVKKLVRENDLSLARRLLTAVEAPPSLKEPSIKAAVIGAGAPGSYAAIGAGAPATPAAPQTRVAEHHFHGEGRRLRARSEPPPPRRLTNIELYNTRRSEQRRTALDL